MPSDYTPKTFTTKFTAGDATQISQQLNEEENINTAQQAKIDNLFNYVVNVRDYGAAGNGTADDTAEIQAAIAAVSSGGAVFFPAGTYKVSGVLAVHKPLRLFGTPSSILKQSVLGNLLDISATSDVVVEGLKFDGNRTALGTGGADALIYLFNVARVRVRNCDFSNLQVLGVDIYRGSHIWVTGNRFSDVYRSAVRLEDPGASNHNEHIWVSDNHFTACPAAAQAGHSAIQTGGTTVTEAHRYIHVLNNTIDLPEGVGIGLDTLYKSNVTGNSIYKDATCTSGETIAFTGSENVIAENYCHNDGTSSAACILLYAVAGANEHNQIINNRCTNGGQGIAFVWGANTAAINDLLIEGNHCYGNNRGIQSYVGGGVSSGSQSRVVITNNDLGGNITDAASELIRNSGGITGVPNLFANAGIWTLLRTQITVSPSSATPTINTDNVDSTIWYGLTVNVTSMTTNLSGTPNDGDRWTIRVQDDGTPRTFTWGAKFTGHLLTTTIAFKTHTQELVYSTGHGQWLGTFVDTAGV